MTTAPDSGDYVAVPADLLRRIRECEGLQNWDMQLCEELDEVMNPETDEGATDGRS